MNNEPVVELLAAEWSAIDDLYSGLEPDDWDRATELPGWCVRDLLSHVIGTELMLLGTAPPQVDLGETSHFKNHIAELNEPWVAARRGNAPAEMVDEFRTVTGRRLEALRAMTPQEFDADSFTPRGPGTYREFMEIRVFDCWMHEQDARRVLGRPGHLTGPVVEQSLDECVRALGFVVAKKAGAAAGTGVVFAVKGGSGGAAELASGPPGLKGEPARTMAVAVTETAEGKRRAGVVESLEGEPDARLGFDTESFVALCGGRWDSSKALTEGRVTLSGDTDLGRRIVENIAFVI